MTTENRGWKVVDNAGRIVYPGAKMTEREAQDLTTDLNDTASLSSVSAPYRAVFTESWM